MQEVRCKKCGKLLFTVKQEEYVSPETSEAIIEIKCLRCKEIQNFDVNQFI